MQASCGADLAVNQEGWSQESLPRTLDVSLEAHYHFLQFYGQLCRLWGILEIKVIFPIVPPFKTKAVCCLESEFKKNSGILFWNRHNLKANFIQASYFILRKLRRGKGQWHVQGHVANLLIIRWKALLAAMENESIPGSRSKGFIKNKSIWAISFLFISLKDAVWQ